jgi:hypothetical protein
LDEGTTMKARFLGAAILLFSLSLLLPSGALALDVCEFTQVEGNVDLLKVGKTPAIPAKVKLGAAERDAVHTKVASRAKLRFIDDTNLTISPKSEITIESYMFDASKAKRQAVTGISQGMMQAVVTNLQKMQEPDFVIKTPTAIMGIRGTVVTVIVGKDEKGRDLTIAHVPFGLMEIQSSDPSVKGMSTLSNGQAVSVLAKEAPTNVVTLTPGQASKISSFEKSGAPEVFKGDASNLGDVLNKTESPGASAAATGQSTGPTNPTTITFPGTGQQTGSNTQ